MSAQPTVAAVVHEQAAIYADRPALVYASDAITEKGDQTLTYRELDSAARRLAVWLRDRVPAGERAMLLYPPGLAFGVAFLGCLYADVIAVPVPMPSETGQRDQRATGIVQDAGVAIMLTDAASFGAITAWRDAAGLGHLACVATDAIIADGDPGTPQWTLPSVDHAAPMMLQYTSGSTSDPKGVIICHDNVLAQVRMSRRVMAVSDQSRFGGWLPMHHDMGLIVQLLQPLILGATSIFTSPFEFLKRPVRWLQLIHRHRVDVSLAPHFAYEVCARQVPEPLVATLDLSGWEVAGIGAEAVRAGTLTAFAERFAPAGFRPEAFTIGYGLAEGTVYVSVGTRAQAPIVRAVDAERLERNEFVPVPPDGAGPSIVSCGAPCEMDIRVADPVTGAPVPDGQVGEVWARGAGIARGYWGAEQATVDTFAARLTTGEGGFLRTGDLGAMYDGELYVTGRLKDLLIIRGRNLHPQDIEYEVRTLHAALNARPGAVFAVAGAEGGEAELVVVIQECSAELARDPGQLSAITSLIREWSARELGFRVAGVVLLRPGRVARTASGKVRRTLMRELFASGSLETLHEDLDPELRRQYRKEPVDERYRRPAVARGAA